MPSGVYDRSDQSKWKPNSGRFKKGEHPSSQTEFKKGIHHSPKTEFKAGVGYTGERTFYIDGEWLRKQSDSHKGQHSSPLTEFQKGEHYSLDTEFSRNRTSGDNHPRWQGGKTPLNQRERNKIEYSEWRLMIFGRDNFTCQHCGKRGSYLNAHHIKSFTSHSELRLDIDNGITLCLECHKKVHGKRKEVMNDEGIGNRFN